MTFAHLKDLLHAAMVRRATTDAADGEPRPENPSPPVGAADTTPIDEAAE